MAYLHRTTKLPSGRISRYHVIGDGASLVNLDYFEAIPYAELESILNKDKAAAKRLLEKKLAVDGEELDFLYDGLIRGKSKGELD